VKSIGFSGACIFVGVAIRNWAAVAGVGVVWIVVIGLSIAFTLGIGVGVGFGKRAGAQAAGG
jgi:hypothetical protein